VATTLILAALPHGASYVEDPHTDRAAVRFATAEPASLDGVAEVAGIGIVAEFTAEIGDRPLPPGDRRGEVDRDVTQHGP
jgi:hypothetical protein